MKLQAPHNAFRNLLVLFLSLFAGLSFANAKTHLHLPKDETGQKPAIILVHDSYGVDSFIQREAEKWTEKNYAVLVVDLFKDKVFESDREADMESQKLVREDAIKKIHNAFDKLKSNSKIDKNKIGILGFGLGGNLALRFLTENSEIKTAVLIETMPILELASLSKIKTRILYISGSKDSRFPKNLTEKFKKMLTDSHVENEMEIISGASKGFMDYSRTKTYFSKGAGEAQKHIELFEAKHLSLTDSNILLNH